MDVDRISRIFDHAAALHALAYQLPIEQNGLALLLNLMGDDLRQCAEGLEDCPMVERRESLAASGQGAGVSDTGE